MLSFYETLAIVMKNRGMTAADLCAKTGVNQSYLSKLKSGYVKEPTWERAVAFCDALDMTPSEFLAVQRGDGR